MQNATNTEFSAAYWAQQIQSSVNALFCNVRVGEAFRFKPDGDVCRKKNEKGWYTVEDGTGRKYQTGRYVGVIRF